MTSRSRSPRDPHNRHNAPSEHSTGSAESTIWLPAVLLAVGTLGYAILFFSTQDRFEWLALTLVPDVIVAHWFGAEGSQFAVLDRLPVVAGALMILGLAYAWGACLLTILGRCGSLGRPASGRWERAMLSFASGLPLVSLVTFLLGVLGWLQASWLAGATFAGVTGLLGLGWFVGRRAMPTPQATPPRDSSGDDRSSATPATRVWTPFEYFLAIIVTGMSLFIVWGGLLPPWEFDVREYHLQAPKEWWQSGQISFLPHNVYANMPLGAEMWALAAMIFWPGDEPWWWGALVGKTVIAAVAPLTAGVLIAIGNRLGSRLAGLVAAALYLTTPWTAHVALAGLIDGVVGYYLAAASLVALGWFESPALDSIPTKSSAAWTSAALVGWLAGAAAACKYPGLVFVVAPLGLCAALYHGWRRFDVRGAAAFALAVTVSAAPWYVKNACVTGNPTYPLLVGVFGGETRTEAKNQQWRDAHRERDSQGRTYTLPLLAKGIAQVGWRSEWLHPVVMPLVLASLAVHWRRRQVMLLVAIVAWVLAVWWLSGHRIDRFWLPALPLLALLAGLVVDGWPSTSSPLSTAWRRTALGFAGVGLALGGLVSCSSRIGDVRLFAPLDDVRQQGQHPLHRELDRLVPPGSRALLVGDAQPFDLTCSAWYSTCFDESPLAALVASPDAEDRRQAFVEARVSHILVDWNEIARYRQPGNYGFSEFVTRELFAELAAGQGVLRLLPGDPRWGELYEVQANPAAD